MSCFARFIAEDVQPALKALVSSVGAGPWLAGLWRFGCRYDGSCSHCSLRDSAEVLWKNQKRIISFNVSQVGRLTTGISGCMVGPGRGADTSQAQKVMYIIYIFIFIFVLLYRHLVSTKCIMHAGRNLQGLLSPHL